MKFVGITVLDNLKPEGEDSLVVISKNVFRLINTN